MTLNKTSENPRHFFQLGILPHLFEVLVADGVIGSFFDTQSVFQMPFFLVLVPKLLKGFPAYFASLK